MKRILKATVRRAVAGLSRVKQRIRHLSRYGLILAYHRIGQRIPDPQMLCVSRQNFSEQLKVLQHHFDVVPLPQVLQRRRGGRIRVALTFDDGYVDNYSSAFPLLEAAATPACFFITAGFMDQARNFYWDELADLLLRPMTMPDELAVSLGGRKLTFGQRQSRREAIASSNWSVLDGRFPTWRHSAYAAICEELRTASADEREAVLRSVAMQIGETRRFSPEDSVMAADMVRDIAKKGLVTIGAHGMNHLSLGTRPSSEAIFELQESRRILSEICETPIEAYAYPYGQRSDYCRDLFKKSPSLGFQQACINRPGVLVSNSNPFLLPRFLVRDWDGDLFLKTLLAWLSTPGQTEFAAELERE